MRSFSSPYIGNTSVACQLEPKQKLLLPRHRIMWWRGFTLCMDLLRRAYKPTSVKSSSDLRPLPCLFRQLSRHLARRVRRSRSPNFAYGLCFRCNIFQPACQCFDCFRCVRFIFHRPVRRRTCSTILVLHPHQFPIELVQRRRFPSTRIFVAIDDSRA